MTRINVFNDTPLPIIEAAHAELITDNQTQKSLADEWLPQTEYVTVKASK